MFGTYLPWAGGPVASAVLSRCLWLWLGLLDLIQGVGMSLPTDHQFFLTLVGNI